MTFKFEKSKLKEGYQNIIGCDEVGKGCLAGPVVAAAVIINPNSINQRSRRAWHNKANDSKKLLPEEREFLEPFIKEHSVWAVALVEPEEIDAMNIHHATLLAMQKAVLKLISKIHYQHETTFMFVDGVFKIPHISIAQEPVVDGDAKILSVSCASILAKVYRDRLMRQMHEQYPVYNFAQHKGYATRDHQKAILEHGLCAIHRLSFCKNILSLARL